MGRAACEGCPFAFCGVNGKIVRNYSYLRGMKQHLVLHNDIREIPELAALVDRIAEAGSLDPTLALNLNLALEEAVSGPSLYTTSAKGSKTPSTNGMAWSTTSFI